MEQIIEVAMLFNVDINSPPIEAEMNALGWFRGSKLDRELDDDVKRAENLESRVVQLIGEILEPNVCAVVKDYLNDMSSMNVAFPGVPVHKIIRYRIDRPGATPFCVHTREELSDDTIRGRIWQALDGCATTS